MSKIKTITLTGEETAVEFDRPFAYVECKNLGTSDVLMSTKSNVKSGNDDTIIITADSAATIGDIGTPKIKAVYLSGSGQVQIIGKGYPQSSFKTSGKGGGSGGIGRLITFGDAAYFDASSIDVENGVWKNILNPGHNAVITSGVSVEGNDVIFPLADYGTYETNSLYTVYVVYKMLSSNGKVVIGKGASNDIRGSAFDVWSSAAGGGNHSALLTNSYNVYSDIASQDGFHVVCIVRSPDPAFPLRAGLYVDNRYYGMTSGDMTESYYTGQFYINTVFRGGKKYDDGNNAFKAIVFDTIAHPVETIIENTKYLKNKYL